jgi:epoxyqueuosine reductase
MTQTSIITELVKKKAIEIGFNAVGITKPAVLNEDIERLNYCISNGYTGNLNYLKENIEIRKDISLLFNNAKSVIIVLSSYYPERKQSTQSYYKISYYTYSNDYHYIIRKKLELLLHYIKELRNDAEGKIFCDSLPIFEKKYASLSGLGWIGKNTLLINSELGSFNFIGGIITNIPFLTDEKNSNYCPDNCSVCIDACPVGAIEAPYILNASKCISYLTIENKNLNLKVNNPTKYIAGCDICQIVCPYNKSINAEKNIWYKSNEYVDWKKEQWEKLTQSQFKKIFKNTVFKRIGYKYLKNNMLNCLP